jgi:predicted aspartyl protease
VVVAIAGLSAYTHAAFTLGISRNPEATNLKKRGLEVRSTVTESLNNNKTGGDYIATVSVGTPGQTITLAIDTGSSDVWMMSADADICTSAALQEQVGKGGCSSTCQSPPWNSFSKNNS